MDRFPKDFDGGLTGFGGDATKDQAQHRASLKKTPVILCHGNGGNSVHPQWGMETLKGFLVAEGYQDAEIWAMDYLGENNSDPDMPTPHRNRIDKFRRFVDSVRTYLGVERLDFIAHSLGCGMVNGYLRGFQSSGKWDQSEHRLDAAGTFVALAGATYGLGRFAQGEFQTGAPFEVESHKFKNVNDDSPFGEDNKNEQGVLRDWIEVTSLDNDQVCYVAIVAQGDFIDAQNPNGGLRKGADLNEAIPLGAGLDGHEKIIKSQTVFDRFKKYLNEKPPVPPVTIKVDKESGNFSAGLQIMVTVDPADAAVAYSAERVTQQFAAGFITRTVLEKRTGTLANGQSLTLTTDGEWQVAFSADGAKAVERTYGVNVAIPEVTILTDNQDAFASSLQVEAKSTAGTLYSSTDRAHWTLGASFKLERTATMSFIAIDSSGLASPIVSRAFQRKLIPERQTATLTQHFIAKRLSVSEFVALGMRLGFNAVVTLYKVGDRWVTDPEPMIAPAVARMAAPVPAAAAEPIEPPVTLTADHASGEYLGDFNVTIRAVSPAAERVRVFYTTDGSDPADEKNANRDSFSGEKTFSIQGNGHHSVLCYAQDSSGNRKFESFAWSIDDHDYPETSISPSSGGMYAGRVEVALQASAPSQWTRYTTDGAEPSDSVGTNYLPGHPIVIEKSTVLKFRSKDLAGNIEPVKAAQFEITPPSHELTFVNDPLKSGYVKGDANGHRPHVGTLRNFVLGTGRDGLDNRVVLHFDTSSLPDNAAITHAHLEVKLHSVAARLQAGGAPIKLDIKSGHFGSSRALNAQDWDAKATAEGVAEFGSPADGALRSSEFSEAGRAAINRSGPTQVRLLLEPSPAATGNFLLPAEGEQARLVVKFATGVSIQPTTMRRPAERALTKT